MKNLCITTAILLFVGLISCSSDTDSSNNFGQIPTAGSGNIEPGNRGSSSYIPSDDDQSVSELHDAFAVFNTEATDIYLSNEGKTVTIETTGLPNHETVYWGEGNALYQEESGVDLTPTRINDNNNAVTITVDAVPNLDGATVATDFDTIGIAVSGSSIFNDQEGGGALNEAAGSLDWTGAHIGPGVYHYHLEPKAFSNDDDKLVGILLDGVFLYGRKCDSTGTYPADLDASGGHISETQYTGGDEEYHYHIINEVYSTTGSYIAFAGPYRGY